MSVDVLHAIHACALGISPVTSFSGVTQAAQHWCPSKLHTLNASSLGSVAAAACLVGSFVHFLGVFVGYLMDGAVVDSCPHHKLLALSDVCSLC